MSTIKQQVLSILPHSICKKRYTGGYEVLHNGKIVSIGNISIVAWNNALQFLTNKKQEMEQTEQPKKYYCVLDNETTGLCRNYKESPTNFQNFPRCIQLAWKMFDEEGTILSEHCHLIKPYGWQVPIDKFWIDNGFSQLHSEATGVSIGDVLDLLIEEVDRYENLTVVCHNTEFDLKLLSAEMIMEGIRRNLGTLNLAHYSSVESSYLVSLSLKFKNKPANFCTMQFGMDLMKIPKTTEQTYVGSAQYKFPNLTEMYAYLFGDTPAQSHKADEDVNSTAAIFFELKKQGLITV